MLELMAPLIIIDWETAIATTWWTGIARGHVTSDLVNTALFLTF